MSLCNNKVECQLVEAEPTHFTLHSARGPSRRGLEAYIAAHYRAIHQARINAFMPILLEMRTAGESGAALGMTPGRYRPLFLEQYLDLPVEQAVAVLARQPVDRYRIIEIGNLVVTRPGLGLPLFVVMAMSMVAAGYQWMVFTATRQVVKLIGRLGFAPQYVVDADPERLRNGAEQWGHYYANQPKVMAGDLREAVAVVNANPQLLEVAQRYQYEITRLAQSLSDFRRLAVQ